MYNTEDLINQVLASLAAGMPDFNDVEHLSMDKSFEYFALKLKAAFPGRGRHLLMLLGEWTAVIKSHLCHTDLGMERESQLFFNNSAA